MRLTSVEPGRWRRLFGYVIGVAGVALLVAVVIHFSANVASLTDILAVALGGFAFLLGALLLSLSIFLSASSILARRIGCIAAMTVGVPFAVLFALLVWSLFQTTRSV